MKAMAQSHLASADSTLRRIIETHSFPAYENTNDVFEDLCSCVLDMRIHYAPSNAAFRYPKLKRYIDHQRLTPSLFLERKEEVTAHLKLSHQKIDPLVAWSSKWNDEALGSIDWGSLADEEVVRHLSGIKGVSAWSRQMILLFTLEREDVFPEVDYQLRKAFCECYGLAEDRKLPQSMLKISQSWRPYRSLGCRYLWRWRYKVK